MANKAMGTDDGTAAVSGSAIQKSFTRATKELTALLRSNDAIYQIPWFGMIGEADSGKDLLLPSTGITARPGSPNSFGLEEDQATFWWFFDNAVVIDFSSTYFAQKGGPGKLKKGLLKRIFGSKKASGAWAEALRALQMNRPRRPLDGMIVAINVNDLKARTPEQTSTLHRKAEAMADRLRETQYELGVHVPVYIVLTGCESITGFQAFGQAVPPPIRQQIFGWSCPYQPDEVYQSDWIDEAIGFLHESTSTSQLDLLPSVTDQDERDALYLLPREINALREPLKMFLEPMFKGTSYRKALPLRGIYLTGKLPVPKGKDTKAPQDPNAPVELGPPAFTKQLFSEKIFQEPGLAVLDEARAKALNKTVRTWKIMSGAAVVLGLLMFWWQSSSTSGKIESFNPILEQLKLYNASFDYGTAVSMEGTAPRYTLLESLTSFNLEQFELYTVPTSFTQPITETASKAFSFLLSNGVGESLKGALVKVAEQAELLNPQLDARFQDVGQPPSVLPDNGVQDTLKLKDLGTSDPQKHFDALRDFAKQVENLYINFQRYTNHTPEDLGELYLFLTKEDTVKTNLEQQADRYRPVLSSLENWPDIPLDIYRNRADLQVYFYLSRLEREVFINHPLRRAVLALNDQLMNIKKVKSNGDSEHSGEYFSIVRLNDAIKTLKNEVAEGKVDWLADPKFAPGDAFLNLIAILNADAFSRGLTQKMGDKVDAFVKRSYAELRESIFDSSNLLEVHENKVRVKAEVLNLEKSLDEFFELRFIVDNPKEFRDELTNIVGRRDEWNNKLDNQLVSWSKDLDVFEDSQRTLLGETHLVLKAAAFKEFSHWAKDIVLNYASPVRNDSSGQVFGQDKETLKRYIVNLASEWDAIIQIDRAVKTVNRKIAETEGNEIYNKLITDARLLLSQVDALQAQEKLYQIRSDKFSWWNTGLNPGAMAFGARDDSDLTARLDSQRQTIMMLAKEYAQPLVEKFTQTGGEAANDTAVTKWRKIIEVVGEYERKVPGNDLEDLERFIEEDLAKLEVLEKCKPVLKDAIKLTSTDFFPQQKKLIAQNMQKRCDEILDTETLRGYVKLQSLFAERLTGRFPFAAPDVNTEAEASDIAEFYRSYDAHAEALSRITKNTLGEAEFAEIKAFISKVKRSRDLFAGLLSSSESDPELVLDTTFAFRANTDSEVNGNQIIEWWAEVNQERIGFRGTKLSAQWKSNDPVKMCFRWAGNGTFMPASEQRDENASVNGKTLCYNYTGRWSLLRMLMKHAATAVDRGRHAFLRPHTLRFEMETTMSGDASASGQNMMASDTRVYVRIGLMLPGGKSAYTLPELPRRAPEANKQLVRARLGDLSSSEY